MNADDEPIDFFPHRKRSYKMDEPMHPAQIAGLRRMTPAQRIETAEAMYRSARQLKRAMLEQQHPGWSAERLDREVTRVFANART